MEDKADDEQINGILAYGSLISDPDVEIENKWNASGRKIIDEVCTPFNVEFARSSKGRGGAPTLVPYNGGKPVVGKVLVMDLPKLKGIDILYRREINKVGKNKFIYPRDRERNDYPANYKNWNFSISKDDENTFVHCLTNFEGLGRVAFAQLAANIVDPTPEHLACLAIISVIKERNYNLERNDAKHDSERDGISYLINAKSYGIVTELSPRYEQKILEITDSKCLDQALSNVREYSEYVSRAIDILESDHNSTL